MLNLLIQYFMFWRKLEYHYFIIGGVTIFSRYGSIYRFTNDTSVWRKELSSFCRMASWSILSKNISQTITYTTLYYIAEIYTKNQRYIAWKDSLFLHHSYKSSTDICWDIDSSGFKVTHASQYYTERTRVKRRKYIKLSLGADVLKQIICAVKIRRAPIRHDTIDFHPHL